MSCNEDKLYQLDNLNNMADGNKQFIMKMLSIFVDENSRLMSEIEGYLHQNNLKEIKRIAHQIKPSVDSVCKSELRLLTRKVEGLDPVDEDIFKRDALLLIRNIRLVITQISSDFQLKVPH